MAETEKEERIRWTPDERERLGKAALPLLIEDPNMTLAEAMRRVQDTVLPEDRRRNLPNIGSIPIELRNWLSMRRAAALGEVSTVDAAGVTKLEDELKEANNKVSDLERKLASANAELTAYRHTPKPPESIDVIKGFFTDILADALARLYAVPGLRMELTKAPPPPKHDPSPKFEKLGRKPKILIVGTKPEQASMLGSEFGKSLDLRFYVADTTADQLRTASGNADATILWTDFISHSTQEAIPREKRVLVSGGMTSLRSALTEIVQQSI